MSDTSEFPKKGSSHHGTEMAWEVEARCATSHPRAFGSLLLGDKWSAVPFEEAAGGVPNGGLFFQGNELGLLTYEAAQALRWWFLASLRVKHESYLVETRLVQHKITYSKTAEAIAATEPIRDADLRMASLLLSAPKAAPLDLAGEAK